MDSSGLLRAGNKVSVPSNISLKVGLLYETCPAEVRPQIYRHPQAAACPVESA